MRNGSAAIGILACAWLWAVPQAQAAVAVEQVIFDIPKLEGISVDGNADDWGERGFRVEASRPDKSLAASKTFRPSVRLGWNDKGVLLLASVADNAVHEEDDPNAFWKGDSVDVELGVGQQRITVYKLIATPGVDGRHLRPRTFISSDRRPLSQQREPIVVDVASRAVPGGFAMEFLFPWKELNVNPVSGSILPFAIYFHESDGADERTMLVWRPAPMGNAQEIYRLHLAETASPAVTASLRGQFEDLATVQISVLALADLAGRACQVKWGDQIVGSGKLVATNGWATSDVKLSIPRSGLDIRSEVVWQKLLKN